MLNSNKQITNTLFLSTFKNDPGHNKRNNTPSDIKGNLIYTTKMTGVNDDRCKQSFSSILPVGQRVNEKEYFLKEKM